MIRNLWLFFAFVLIAALSAAMAFAQVPPAETPQPRTLGNKAAMVIYYYAPKTLEITYVDTYLFVDGPACQAAIPKAGMISSPHTSRGDRLDIQCVTMNPPRPPKKAAPDGSVTL